MKFAEVYRRLGEFSDCLMDVDATQASAVVHPAQAPHRPSMLAQGDPVWAVASGRERPMCLYLVKWLPGSARPARDWRDCIRHRQQLRHMMAPGGGERRGHLRAVAIGQQVVPGAIFLRFTWVLYQRRPQQWKACQFIGASAVRS